MQTLFELIIHIIKFLEVDMGCCGGGGETATLEAYQEISGQTAIYPNKGSNMSYPTLGLCGEAGEIANKDEG